MVNHDGTICLVNAKAEESFGYHRSELIGKPIEVVVPSRFQERHVIDRATFSAAPHFRRMGRGREIFGRRKDGGKFPVEIDLQMLPTVDGNFVLATIVDITERTQAEATLRASKELAGSILNAISAHVAILDGEGNILAVNAAWERFSLANSQDGLARAWVGHNYFDVCRGAVGESGEQMEQILDGLKRVLDGSLQEFIAEYPCHSPTEQRWFLLQVTPLSVSQGGAVVAHTSITEQKRAEEFLRQAHDELEKKVQERTSQLLHLNNALRNEVEERRIVESRLRESEERMRLAMDAAQISTWDWDVASGNVIWSDNLESYLGITPGTFGGTFDAFQALVHPSDRQQIVAALDEALQQRKPYQVEFRMIRPDGSVRWAATKGRVFFDPRGRPVRILGVDVDITERKQAEIAVIDALVERETLLKEVHHRVKNNLQVVSSLLHLQSLHVQEKASVELFRESQHRVRSMALVHERLYRSPDLERVDFKDYIETLAKYLFRSYEANSDRIRLEVEVHGVRLPSDAAVPCGLLVNELISNCLKHAFQGRQKGVIRVELVPIAQAKALLSVSDDGVGLPSKVAETFGMQLIAALVDQLHGNLEFIRQDGTNVRIIFPVVD